MTSPPEAGGFLHLTLPTPPMSTVASPSITSSTLPYTRSHPLKSGSSKESSFIDYVDRQFLEISRRYEKRYNDGLGEKGPLPKDHGYESFGEVAKDLESVVDVVWVSASLQTPYLLTVALNVTTYLPSFPFSPRRTFTLLQKLDITFSSLLQGRNAETGDALSGFEGGRGKLSTTEKVRLRGLVARTRVAMVDVAGKGASGMSDVNATTDTEVGCVTEADAVMVDEDDDTDDNDFRRWEMDVARVYERTIIELGVALDTPSKDHS